MTMPEKEKIYNCVCWICKKSFQSKNALNLDGDGKCEDCQSKHDKIAEQVQKTIDSRRALRGEPIGKTQVEFVPNGITAINYKQLL